MLYELNYLHFIRGRIHWQAAALAVSIALVGCADYSGEGDEFRVRGEVVEAGDESLKVRISGIDYTYGRAEDWFELDAVHQLHDNCECHGFWSGKRTYGIVYDENNDIIEPDEVPLRVLRPTRRPNPSRRRGQELRLPASLRFSRTRLLISYLMKIVMTSLPTGDPRQCRQFAAGIFHDAVKVSRIVFGAGAGGAAVSDALIV
jgi:hypothetical protein